MDEQVIVYTLWFLFKVNGIVHESVYDSAFYGEDAKSICHLEGYKGVHKTRLTLPEVDVEFKCRKQRPPHAPEWPV